MKYDYKVFYISYIFAGELSMYVNLEYIIKKLTIFMSKSTVMIDHNV